MMMSPSVRKGAFPGAAAGLIVGAVFAPAPAVFGVPQSAALFGLHLPGSVAVLLSLITAVTGGASFGILVWKQRFGAGEMVFWGMAYGILKWFLVPLTLVPLLRGGSFAWSVEAAQTAIPGLFECLLSGAAAAVALAVLRREPATLDAGPLYGRLLRGAAAGATAMLALALILRAQERSPTFIAATGGETFSGFWPGVLLIGVLGGMGFSLLYPTPGGAGPGLIRGAMYGFFWWVAGNLTVIPLIGGSGVAWTLPAARAHFVMLPGHVLAGAAVALVYQWLTVTVRYLFSDGMGSVADEGLAARGLGLIGRGALAGMVGGLLFTIVMLRINELPAVARLVGASSPWTGFTVHLTIAEIVGATYGLLFARRSHDLGSAVGWGVSYGFFWWMLGPLTFAPILLGAAPRWTAAAAAALLPSLVGHLMYGAALGVTFHLLEARHSPWWIPRTEMEETAAARRTEQVLTSAPALWALIVVIALVLPILLAS
jgi:uncharacterized membrane protein YagU involved in acid resistance